jgi:hypothetical protein
MFGELLSVSDLVFPVYNGLETDKCCFHQAIFSRILLHGRLSLPELEEFSHLTVRHGLVALILQRLVYHVTDDDCTVYEANPEAAYYYLRSRKMIHLVDERLGQAASQVMEEILYLGYISVFSKLFLSSRTHPISQAAIILQKTL